MEPRSRLFDSTPEKPQPAPAAAVQRFRIPKLRTTQPQEAAAPTSRAESADAMPAEFLTTGDRSRHRLCRRLQRLRERIRYRFGRFPSWRGRRRPWIASLRMHNRNRPRRSVRRSSHRCLSGSCRCKGSEETMAPAPQPAEGDVKDCRRAPLHRTDRSQRRTRARL